MYNGLNEATGSYPPPPPPPPRLSVKIVELKSMNQFNTTPLNSQGQIWQRALIEARHVKKLWLHSTVLSVYVTDMLHKLQMAPSLSKWLLYFVSERVKKHNKQNNSLVTLIGFHKCVQDRVISKESVGNSSDILDANVDHKYQNHSNRVIASELNEHFQQKWLWITVCKWASPQHTINCFADISTLEACTVPRKLDHYIKCPKGAYAHWKTYNYMIKLTF